MEEQLPARLCEGQISELVERGEVLAGQVIGNPALPTVSALGFEPVDQIDDVVEATARAAADAAPSDGNGEMRFAGSGRTSVIMPGVRRLKFRSVILSIRVAARLSSLWVVGAKLASII